MGEDAFDHGSQNQRRKLKEVEITERKEDLMKGVKDLMKQRMSEKETNRLVEELFSEKLEQDSWFNSYPKPIKNFKAVNSNMGMGSVVD